MIRHREGGGVMIESLGVGGGRDDVTPHALPQWSIELVVDPWTSSMPSEAAW